MPQRLVLRLLGDGADTAHWVRLDAAGRLEGAVETGPLAAAAAAAAGHRVLALAPTAETLLLAARVPPMPRQRAARAVPFALEDQLADDVDSLHFCLGGRTDRGELAVAVVSHGQMQAWLDAFRAAGLDVEQIYPELFGLPYEAGAWTLLVEDGGFLLRTAPQAGFAGETENLAVLLQAALEEAGEGRPDRLIAYSNRELPLPDLADLPVEQRGFDEPTLLLAQHLREREAIGLRSGPYARPRGWSVQWRRWRVAAILLAAWVLLDTGSAYLQQWQLRRELAGLQASMAVVYGRAFPEGGRLNPYNPRQQFESRLAALRRSAGGGSGVLHLLQTIGPLLAADPNLQITTLAYTNNGLDLEVSAPNLQGIDQLKQRLAAASGIGVEVVSARAEGQRAQGRLRIEASS